jgi:uncharacterized membrane protein YoaK (UPF0700 family)
LHNDPLSAVPRHWLTAAVDRPNFVADERHGSLPAVLLALTFASGLIDAISIISLGHVFVANMTGNIVFVGFAISGVPGFSLRNSLFALAGFVVGAMLGGRMLERWGGSRPVLLRNAVLVESVLIAACLVISIFVHLREDGPVAATVVVAIAAVAMGIQNVSARRMGVPDLTTTLLTMTLISFVADRAMFAKSALRRIAIIATMLAGAIVGAVLVLQLSTRAGFVALLVVLVAVTVALTLIARHEQPWHA